MSVPFALLPTSYSGCWVTLLTFLCLSVATRYSFYLEFSGWAGLLLL